MALFVTATASGTVSNVSTPDGTLLSVNLCAGTAAAAATVRDTDVNGRIITQLAAPANQSTGRWYTQGVEFPSGILYVQLSGNGALLDAEVT